MARKRKTYYIADDTPIMPEIVADQVVSEVEGYVGEHLGREYQDALVKHAHDTYNANARFRKQVRGHGDTGRDTLYSFMRHWLASDLKKKRPKVYRKLPKSFAVGETLRNSNPSSQTSESDLVKALKF